MPTDIRRQLADAASAPSASPDVDRLWQQEHARRSRRRLAVAVVAAAMAATVAFPALRAGTPGSPQLADRPGATDVPDEVRAKQPAPSGAPTPRGTLTVTPNPAVPGQIVELRFSPGTDRGVMCVLQEASGADSWVDVAYMFTDGNGGEPVTYTVEESPANLGVPGVRVARPEPDRVRLPERLVPGSYRVCEGDHPARYLCADLHVSQAAG